MCQTFLRTFSLSLDILKLELLTCKKLGVWKNFSIFLLKQLNSF